MFSGSATPTFDLTLGATDRATVWFARLAAVVAVAIVAAGWGWLVFGGSAAIAQVLAVVALIVCSVGASIFAAFAFRIVVAAATEAILRAVRRPLAAARPLRRGFFSAILTPAAPPPRGLLPA